MEKKGECFRLSSVRGKNVSTLANKPSKASEYFDLLKPQKILFLALALKQRKLCISFSSTFTILMTLINTSKEGELEFIKKGKITG